MIYRAPVGTTLQVACRGNLGLGVLQEKTAENRKTSGRILGKTSIGHAVDVL